MCRTSVGEDACRVTYCTVPKQAIEVLTESDLHVSVLADNPSVHANRDCEA